MAVMEKTRELTVREFGLFCGLPCYTILRLLAKGIIKGAKRYPRGRWRIPEGVVPSALESLRLAGYGTETSATN